MDFTFGDRKSQLDYAAKLSGTCHFCRLFIQENKNKKKACNWKPLRIARCLQRKKINHLLPKKSSISKYGNLYSVEASGDMDILQLSWTLSYLQKQFLHKPDGYVCHILEYEGPGSLFSLLKSRGWATSLTALVEEFGVYRTSIAYIFVISIHLTQLGLQKSNEDRIGRDRSTTRLDDDLPSHIGASPPLLNLRRYQGSP